MGLLLAALGFSLSTTLTRAQETRPGVEVRLGARVLADGAVEVGLQHRFSGRWRSLSPARHMLRVDAPAGAWRSTSSVDVPIRQTQVRISTQYRVWDGDAGSGEFIFEINGQAARTSCREIEIELEESDLIL